jgi:hypothetical protein
MIWKKAVAAAVPKLKRLVAGFPPRRPWFASGQHVGFFVDKAALGQVFSEYFGFPCNHFTNLSIIIITELILPEVGGRCPSRGI